MSISSVQTSSVFANLSHMLHLSRIKNGGRGTKPTYLFMVIIPLLVIELKATPNGNPSDDFYWRQKSNSLNLVPIIPPVGLLYFTSKSI